MTTAVVDYKHPSGEGWTAWMIVVRKTLLCRRRCLGVIRRLRDDMGILSRMQIRLKMGERKQKRRNGAKVEDVRFWDEMISRLELYTVVWMGSTSFRMSLVEFLEALVGIVNTDSGGVSYRC